MDFLALQMCRSPCELDGGNNVLQMGKKVRTR
jgi:hypothetical protein